MTVLSGLYSSNDVDSDERSLYSTVSSNLPSDRVATLATSAVDKCDSRNVFIIVNSLTVI